MAVGGHWQKNDEAVKNFMVSSDNGESWKLGESMPNGFRSCIRCAKHSNKLITSGRNGVDISSDNGKTWIKTDLPPFYAFDISDNEDLMVFAGAYGKVAVKR